MSEPLTGSCLCGAVHFTAPGDTIFAGHCQCPSCRKTSATGHSSAIAVPEPGSKVTGPVTLYKRVIENGNEVTRAFCPTCGAQVYSKSTGLPGVLILRASLLDDQSRFQPQMVIYAKDAAPWDHIDPALARFQTMPG